MSELQAALLAIGLGVMLVVYLYGWWQQRRLSRKFGTTFKSGLGDALYQDGSLRPVEHTLAATSGEPAEHGVKSDVSSDKTGVTQNVLDESCSLLDVRSDFIVELGLHEPASGSVLDGFWQRKFDFGKPVQVCGLTLQNQRWERVIAEGQTLYVNLRIAVQLVDRGGVISLTKLADFRDLILGIAKQIRANTAVPDLNDTHEQAVELDALCAQVDQMVGINLLPTTGRQMLASRIAQAAALHGMRLESDGAFHLFNEQGLSLFSLINHDTRPFQHHTLATDSSVGLTLLLDVPRVQDPARQFDLMTQVAHGLAQELQLNLVDDQRVVLSASGLERIRAQIATVDAQMRENGIVPGSAQARRLFS